MSILSIRPIVRATLTALLGGLIVAPALAEETDGAPPDAPPEWKGKVSLGGSLSRGNVDSVVGVLEAAAERDFDPHMIRLGLYAGYGRADGDTNNDRQQLTEYYRRSLTDRLYAYADSLQGRDSVQRIKFRFLANAGPGYRVWEGGEKRFFDVEAGFGYRYESRKGDNNRSDPMTRFAGNYSNEIGPAVFTQTGEFLLPLNDSSAWLARARTGLSFPLTDAWAFENSLLLEYNNDPVIDNGVPLEKFELDYIISLVYEF